MKKKLLILLIGLVVLSLIYFFGPDTAVPNYTSTLPNAGSIDTIENYVAKEESRHKIKPGNAAEIVWADTNNKQPTEYVVVYLHGFSASKEEGNPVHYALAKKLKANLFLARLADHGVDTIAPMQYFTAERLWESAKQALAIGQKLGKKVILAGTSTGGTLALQLAATYPDAINKVILLSPNIAINDNSAFLLNDPWGLQIARTVIGGKERKLEGKSEAYEKYWYTHYRLESVVQLEELLETTMTTTTFKKVKVPLLMLYYYKSETEQDPVVKVDAMLKMFDALGTPKQLKFKVAIPNAANHVIGSYITSKDLPSVENAIDTFIDQTK